MKLVWKTALGLLLGMCVAMAGYVYIGIRRHIADYQADVRRDQDTMARAIGAAVGAVWRADGEARAMEIILAANERWQDVEIRWVEPRSVPGDPYAPRDPEAAARALAVPGSAVHGQITSDGKPVFYTYRALTVDGLAQGDIEITEVLTEEHAIIADRIVRTVITGAAMVAIAAVLAVVLGNRFVARPIARIVHMARRVGDGDFSARVDVRTNDELGQLAGEMNVMADKLDEAISQLRHADRLTTVGKLASGVAHELGTPLHVIAGRARAMAADKALPDKASKSASTIVQQVDRITHIVRQLLDFARGPAVRSARTDLVETLNETAGLLGSIADKRGVRLEVEAPEEAPLTAEVDRLQVQQVVTNLVVNAIHASPRGALVVMGGEPARLEDGRFVRLFVRDQGCGIQPDVLPHIFEPFFTTKDVGEGTGLGLSVAHGIVRQHRGWIDVQSQPGHGSCFSVFLPAEAA